MSQPITVREQPSLGRFVARVRLLGCRLGFYGVVGWLLDRWLDTSFLLPIGIIVGAMGLYLTLQRLQPNDHD